MICLFAAMGTLGLFIYKQYYFFSNEDIDKVVSCRTDGQLISDADFSYYS